jgi:hypothetical protein
MLKSEREVRKHPLIFALVRQCLVKGISLVARGWSRWDRRAMIYKLAFFVTLAFAFASCTSTDFQAWEGGNFVVQGHGGTRKVVDGMDVWTHGDPPRRFKVLGIIENERDQAV